MFWHCSLGGRKSIQPVKNGGWWRWALVSPDEVAPSWSVGFVGVIASVNHPLHHKVHKFSSGTGSPGWSRKKGHKTVVLVVVLHKQYEVHNRKQMYCKWHQIIRMQMISYMLKASSESHLANQCAYIQNNFLDRQEVWQGLLHFVMIPLMLSLQKNQRWHCWLLGTSCRPGRATLWVARDRQDDVTFS